MTQADAAVATAEISRENRGVREIIAAAGGAVKIAEASAGDISVDAVYKWAKNGISDRHWPLLISLAVDLSADELLAANVATRNSTGG